MTAITVVVLCEDSNGVPDFFVTKVEITDEQYKNGDHYDLAESEAEAAGYKPIKAFDEKDRAFKLMNLPKANEPMLFVDLPYGTRFKYEGGDTIYVLMEKHGTGLIAKWEGIIPKFIGQGIYSAVDLEKDLKTLRVIPVL